jgi:putative ABC transport system ATP-binding protein
MLSLRDVRKTRGSGSQRYSLVIPHLQLAPGEQWALVGASGSGKSTVLNLLALVLSPDHAQRFDLRAAHSDVDIVSLWRDGQHNQLASLRSRHLGYVLQTGGLLNYLSVRGNIALPRKLLNLHDDGSILRLAEQLGITDQLDKQPQALSVGQRQRVSCARALAHAPQLVLADEPTAALDPLNAERVLQLLLEQAAKLGSCSVIATHDGTLAQRSGLRSMRIECQRDVDGGVTATLEQIR